MDSLLVADVAIRHVSEVQTGRGMCVTKVVGAVQRSQIRARRLSFNVEALENFRSVDSVHPAIATRVMWMALRNAMKILPAEAFRLEDLIVERDRSGAFLSADLPSGHRLHVGLRVTSAMLDPGCTPGTWVIEGGCYMPDSPDGQFVFEKRQDSLGDLPSTSVEIATMLVQALFRAKVTAVS